MRRPEIPTIIVFEKRPRWTPELQRRFHSDAVNIRGCDSVLAAPDLAAGEGVACVLLSLENAEGDCLQLVARIASRQPEVSLIALGEEQDGGLEWSFRELGATEFLTGIYTAADVARICRRQLAAFRAGNRATSS